MKNRYIKLISMMLVTISLFLLSIPSMYGCSGESEFVIPTRKIVDETIKKYGSYEYMLYDDNTAKIVAYNGSESVLVIPDQFESYTVSCIGEGVFAENTSIVSVKFNKSLESIEDHAFYGCTSLTEVVFNDKLWSVGLAVFEETPWFMSLSDEFTVVGNGILIKYNGTKTDVVIPDTVKHISSAFGMNYDVLSVEMGNSVLTIGSGAFAYCNSLKRVIIGENVRIIRSGAFDGCEEMTYVNIPDKVEIIEEYAFNYCTALTGIKLGKSVRVIERFAFCNCLRMKNVTIPASVQEIGYSAFADCLSIYLVTFEGGEEQFESLELDGTNRYLTDAERYYPETEDKS